MGIQHGNSSRGPSELDRAEQNGASSADVNIDDRDEGNYRVAGPIHSGSGSGDEGYSAGLHEGEEPLLSEGEKVGPWDEAEAVAGARDDVPLSDAELQSSGRSSMLDETEDDVRFDAGNVDDEPAGGLRADSNTSEQPDNPESRWGANRPADK